MEMWLFIFMIMITTVITIRMNMIWHLIEHSLSLPVIPSEPDMIYQDYSEQDHSEPSDDDYNHNPNPTLSLSAIYVSRGLETQGCESDTSDSDASFHSVTSGRIDHSQYGCLRTVTVHSLDHNSQQQTFSGMTTLTNQLHWHSEGTNCAQLRTAVCDKEATDANRDEQIK